MKKVLVAMSGGVDSSFAAGELVRQGFQVIGVFLNFWHDKVDEEKENKCCSLDARETARAVAQKLGIKFYVLNYQDDFKKDVVDYFLREYKSGRTPNPCVVCNEKIKFGKLLSEARRQKCDFLTTGHYARILPLVSATKTRLDCPSEAIGLRSRPRSLVFARTVPARPPNGFLKQSLALFQGIDQKKDQSYFLWRLKKNQLKYLKFPCGDFQKSKVKKMVKRWGLPSAQRHESQEICFVNGALKDFLKRYLKAKPGPIKDKEGRILGRHVGLIYYTIGQRRDLGLGDKVDNPVFDPYYVVRLDSKKNTLVVGKEEDLYSKKLIANSVNWLTSQKFNNLAAKIRYGAKVESCQVKFLKNDRIGIEFDEPQKAITPGQSIVFYRGNEMLGGGIIAH